jgi:hypothetical protein
MYKPFESEDVEFKSQRLNKKGRAKSRFRAKTNWKRFTNAAKYCVQAIQIDFVYSGYGERLAPNR